MFETFIYESISKFLHLIMLHTSISRVAYIMVINFHGFSHGGNVVRIQLY